jgi:hypothetical protein
VDVNSLRVILPWVSRTKVAVLRKNSISTENHAPMSTAILTKSGGISPSILMMQTTEYRFRNDLSCLGYCFHPVACRQFLLDLIGNTWSQ